MAAAAAVTGYLSDIRNLALTEIVSPAKEAGGSQGAVQSLMYGQAEASAGAVIREQVPVGIPRDWCWVGGKKNGNINRLANVARSDACLCPTAQEVGATSAKAVEAGAVNPFQFTVLKGKAAPLDIQVSRTSARIGRAVRYTTQCDDLPCRR